MTTKNIRTTNRINTIDSMLSAAVERLGTLKEGTKAHGRCAVSIQKLRLLRSALVLSVEARNERHAAWAEKVSARKPQTGERFDVAVGDDLVGYSDDHQALSV